MFKRADLRQLRRPAACGEADLRVLLEPARGASSRCGGNHEEGSTHEVQFSCPAGYAFQDNIDGE